jgi:hypothetical protein
MNPSSFMHKTVLAALLLCTFTPGPSQIVRQDMINWRTYRQGALSNARGTLTNVFETQGQFESYWERVNGTIAGKMPTGGIDWGKEKLIAINLGPRANIGYEVIVRSITRVRTGEIQVLFQEQLPLRGVNYPQIQVSPWVLVKMDRTPGQITFKGETVNRLPGVIQGANSRCCGDVCRCCNNCGCCGEEH